MRAMKISIITAGLLLASSASFAAQDTAAVAKVLSVKGKALIENAQGVRKPAQANMTLSEGSSLIVLDKAQVSLKYADSKCTVSHKANTLVSVSAATQCAPGQDMSVGAAAAGPKSVVGAAPSASVASTMASLVVPAGVLAGVVALGAVIDNNSTSP